MSTNTPKQKTTPIKAGPPGLSLPCELCGFDLARDIDRGWVAWHRGRGTTIGKVHTFAVVCGRGTCNLRFQHQHGVTGLADDHLDSFTGRLALLRLTHLMGEYEWEREALTKCLDFFPIAALLPSCSPEREASLLRLWGTSPDLLPPR